jgi:undecaprenyl-diphosphatase
VQLLLVPDLLPGPRRRSLPRFLAGSRGSGGGTDGATTGRIAIDLGDGIVIGDSFLPARTKAKINAFDRLVDDRFEQFLRHDRVANRVFYGASAAGEHGLVWMGLAGAQALRHRHGDWSRPLVRAVLGLVVESIVVNGPIKWMFGRQRPVQVSPRPLHLRQPRTSSFPSGHASAAFYGAALLRDNDPWWPAYYLIGVIVAVSRVHVRIHHASDVVGGMVVGAVLGELTRLAVPLAPAHHEDRSGR